MSTAPYTMTVTVHVEDANGTAMMDNNTTYRSLGYDNLVELEAALMQAAQSLGEKMSERKRGSKSK